MAHLARRNFIGLVRGVAGWPVIARAQAKVRCIGVLVAVAESDMEARANVEAFQQTLQMLGWIEAATPSSTIWGGSDSARIRFQAKELVKLDPDVMLVSTGLALQPLIHETRSIPIVFTQIVDPVGAGLVATTGPYSIVCLHVELAWPAPGVSLQPGWSERNCSMVASKKAIVEQWTGKSE